MRRLKLPVKEVAIAVLLCLFSLPLHASGQDSAREFALRLRSIIVSGDRTEFRNIGCYPADCIDDDDVTFVFGAGECESYIRKFLSNPAVETRVFGPFTYSNELKDSSYVIMYFDPETVKFDPRGTLSPQQRENLWWTGYIETVISPVGSSWGFHRTPFYHGADPPWLEDY